VLILAGTKQLEWTRAARREEELRPQREADHLAQLNETINRFQEENTQLHADVGRLTAQVISLQTAPAPEPDLSNINAELQTVTPEVDYEALLAEAKNQTLVATELEAQLKAQLAEITGHAEQLMQEYFNKEVQYKELLIQMEQLNQDQEIQATLLANALQRNQDADEQRHHAYTVLEQRNQEIAALNQQIAELTRVPEPEPEPIQEAANLFKFVPPPVPETAPKTKATVEPAPEPEIVTPPAYDPDDGPLTDHQIEQIQTLVAPRTDFGPEFPGSPAKGDMFLRTDFKPSRLFKWNDQQWIQINKNATDAYVYNEQYIGFLITKLQDREYEWDELTAAEQQQVEAIMGGPIV
jgi:hypothetical protein